MKNTIYASLRVVVSLLLIVILLYIMRGKYGEILKALKSTRISIFWLGFLVFLGAIAIASVRLQLIIRAQEVHVTFIEALSLTFIGYFFNNFLPTTIGGDVVKAYYLSKKAKETVLSFTSVFVDRLIGLFTMVFMAFVALFFAGGRIVDNTMKYLIYAITIFSILILIFAANKSFARAFSFILVFFKPIEEKLRRAYDAINKYRHHNILIAQSFVISIVSQLLFFASLGILAFSIGSSIPMVEILLRMPIIGVLSLLPSINGLGLREGSTVVFFGPMIGKENAFAVSILWLLVLFLTSIIGGIIYGLSPQFKVKEKKL